MPAMAQGMPLTPAKWLLLPCLQTHMQVWDLLAPIVHQGLEAGGIHHDRRRSPFGSFHSKATQGCTGRATFSASLAALQV